MLCTSVYLGSEGFTRRIPCREGANVCALDGQAIFFLLSLAHRSVNYGVGRSPLPVNEWLNDCLLYSYSVFVVDDVSALNHCLKQLYFPVGLLFLVYDVARFFAECVFNSGVSALLCSIKLFLFVAFVHCVSVALLLR
jgi:hypothetical protein